MMARLRNLFAEAGKMDGDPWHIDLLKLLAVVQLGTLLIILVGGPLA